MKHSLLVLLLIPAAALAHPSIGLVCNSKGVLFYTDLEQVWRLENGKKTIAVPHVHTHELYIDPADNLYGEDNQYEGEATNRYNHYMWVLRPNGRLDTVVGKRQAYVRHDFSLARDAAGTEYYLKQGDTTHIYRKPAGGAETVMAQGQYSGVRWLHPQPDGSVLFAVRNQVHRIDRGGKESIVMRATATGNPSFKYYGDSTVWGMWQDRAGAVYVAIFSDQAVKKVDRAGRESIAYRSTGPWGPTHGVFDNKGRLWVMECSDKNEVRVVLAGGTAATVAEVVGALGTSKL